MISQQFACRLCRAKRRKIPYSFIIAKVDNPEARRLQMVEQMRNTKRKEIVSKKRQYHVPDQFQEREIQYFDQENFKLSGQGEDLGFGKLLQDSTKTV